MSESIQNIQTTKYSARFWLMMSVFLALFILRNLVGISFPVVVFLLWVAVMAVCLEEHEIKAVVVSFIPLFPAFQNKYATLVCLAVLMVKCYKQIKIRPVIFSGVCLLFWELFHHEIGNFSFVDCFASFVELFFIMMIICIEPKKRADICQLSRVLAIASLVSFTILFFNTLEAENIKFYDLLNAGFRLGTVEEVEVIGYQFSYNANELGFICNLTIALLFANLYHKKGNIWDVLMIIFMLFVGALTISRTFLLLFAGTVFLFILLKDASISKKIRNGVFLIAIVAVGLLLLYLLYPNIIMNYIARFSEKDVTGGRTYLFEFYNQFIFSSPNRLFFGIGMQEIAEKVYLFEHVNVQVPHNGYQEILVAWGIPGFLMLAILVIGLIRIANKRRRSGKMVWIQYLPLLLLLINIMGGQFFTHSFKMLTLYLAYECIIS